MKNLNRSQLLWVVPVLMLAVVAFVAAAGAGSFTANAQEATPEATTTPTAADQTTTVQDESAFAEDQAVVVTTTNGNSLNFREDASTDAEVIASLPEGTFGVVVDGPVDADDTTWYEIEVDEVNGFVSGEFLADAATEGSFEADTSVYVNTDDLNLRGSANIDSGVLTQLTRNTEATVLDGPTEADDYSWYELDVDGTTGWAAREFLALAPSEGATVVDETAEGTSLSVNTDSLNVRDAAGLDANVLETLALGDTVTDLGAVETVDGFDWTQVETSSGTSGWAASIYLSADSAALQLTVDAVATVNADGVNVRDTPSVSGASIGTLDTGATVTILSDSEAADDLLWYQVETDLGTGWIAGDFLTVGATTED